MAHIKLYEELPLEGSKCLEIGAGYVFSHSIVLYLLGAKKIVSSDINHIARPESLRKAINLSINSIPRDILSLMETMN